MFFDSEIKIELDELPKILRQGYLTLKEYYEKNEDYNFYPLAEVFEANVKNCCIENKITKKQQQDLFHVIGIY